jgi:hypothetical protein
MPKPNEIPIELANVAYHATNERDIDQIAQVLWEATSLDGIRRLFTDAGIRWARIIEEEVTGVLDGQPRKYFLSAQEWVELYQERRGIVVKPLIEPEVHHFVGEGELEAYWEHQRRRKHLFETHGATPEWYESGYACIKERTYFYGTEEWQNRAKAMRYVARYECESCHTVSRPLEVHHLSPIVSAYSHDFDVNFASERLQVLCTSCHRQLHAKSVPAFGNYGYLCLGKAEYNKYRLELDRADRAYHKPFLCAFCRDRIATRYPNKPL